MSGNHYVYMYWDKDMVARYVGMGGTKNRWKSHLSKSDNIWLRKMVSSMKKAGLEPIHRKVSEGLSREEACAEEIRLIAIYGREGLDREGTLYNRALGGDAGKGVSRSQSDKERLDRAKKMQIFWNSPEGQSRKKSQSEKAKIQMSTPEAKKRTAAVGRARKGKKDWKHTPETIAKIKAKMANRARGDRGKFIAGAA